MDFLWQHIKESNTLAIKIQYNNGKIFQWSVAQSLYNLVIIPVVKACPGLSFKSDVSST